MAWAFHSSMESGKVELIEKMTEQQVSQSVPKPRKPVDVGYELDNLHLLPQAEQVTKLEEIHSALTTMLGRAQA